MKAKNDLLYSLLIRFYHWRIFSIDKEIAPIGFVTFGYIFEDNRHIEAFCIRLRFLDRHDLLNGFSNVEDRKVFPELPSLDLSVVK